jgi:large subunit ribosomal protein L1
MGKCSFETEKLAENYGALLTELLRVKPSTSKGRYVKSVVVSSTMGPGVKIDPQITRDFLTE